MKNEINLNRLNITDKFFIIWSFFIPISTWVIDPSIKGSLISYLLAFLSPLVIIFFRQDIIKAYILDIIKITLVLLFFALMSQLANTLFNIQYLDLVLVNPENFSDKFFRSSLITQSLYLIPSILTFLYIKYLYKPSWDKWIIYGGLVFVIYGFYKWLGFLILGFDIDFLTNRTFGTLDEAQMGQYFVVAGTVMQRFQSLTGEPSMFAFTILPYFIFAIHKKANIVIISVIGLSILVSTSTTAYLGLFIYLIYLLFYVKKDKKFMIYLLLILALLIMLYFIFYNYINDIVNMFILNKSDSGSANLRTGRIEYNLSYIAELDYLHMLFGIGFGYIRAEDLFSTLLVNTGILGLLIFMYFYLKDFSLKVTSFKVLGYNAILLVSFITSMLAVPEFSYLSFWIFLAIIRNEKQYVVNKR